LRNLQNQFGNEVARTQQTFKPTAVNNQLQPSLNNQFQQQAAAPIQQSSQVPSRINTAQNSFSLLNTNNFQAFDAQFGGAVPSNPGAANLNSNIFSRPQFQTPSQPQQPRFQPQPVQRQPQQPQPQQAQFQPQTPQFQSQQPQQSIFTNPNVPASRFTGHPASNIDLNTGSFSLQTGK
jgi:hypothetical protein